MKVFSDKKRKVIATRRKYGAPENKQEALERLKKEREAKEKKLEIIEQVKNKNKDEFHFAYYSLSKDMIKRTTMKKDDLKKLLKYADSEILRSERLLECKMRKERKNTHIKFDVTEDESYSKEDVSEQSVTDDESYSKEDVSEQSVTDDEDDTKQREVYIEMLKEKRGEIIELINKEDTKKSKRR
ncbi:hypothetical protein GINT2_000277 [Glugoides intestinalis]